MRVISDLQLRIGNKTCVADQLVAVIEARNIIKDETDKTVPFTAYALHHGFAKGALFLSSGLPLPGGLRQRQAVLIVLALPALVLAGLPFSSGEEVKNLLTQALSGERAHGLPWAARLPALLTLSTFTTVLLLVRWWWLLRRQLHAGPASWTLWLGWAMLAALLCGLPLFHWGPV